jgi:hypothetical protein
MKVMPINIVCTSRDVLYNKDSIWQMESLSQLVEYSGLFVDSIAYFFETTDKSVSSIKELVDMDIDVIGADFDNEIVGKKLFGKAEIVHGEKTLETIKKCDVAIITGMTLTTNTLDEIITTANESNTKIVMFAETGSNLGDFYVKNGVDCVIGEPFPFYIFQGKNTLNIFRKA